MSSNQIFPSFFTYWEDAFHTFVFDILSAALLRGKCNVTLLNETDVLAGYLEKEVNMPSVYLSRYFDT